MSYEFKDPEIQKRWLKFSEEMPGNMAKIASKVPKNVNPNHSEIEELIRYVMEKMFRVAEIIGEAEYFHELAYSEAFMDVYEQNPKKSTTTIKAETDGKISQVTGLLAHIRHTWKAMENCLMGAQSLLKRMP